MKRPLIIIMVMFLVFFLYTCAIEPETWDYTFKHDIEITSARDAMNWITYNVMPVSDNRDYWQSPEETYALRGGDCEDMCILFMYLIHEQLGMNPELHILRVGDTGIYHAVVWCNDIYYNVAGNNTGVPDNMQYRENHNYGRTMWLATVYFKE